MLAGVILKAAGKRTKSTNNKKNLSKTLINNKYATEAKVAKYSANGRPENVVKLEKVTLQSPAKNQVLVKMLYAPINPSDINMIEGTYAINPPLPAIPGNEGIGQVVELGSDVKGLQVNDYVIPAKPGFGTWRSHALCSSGEVIKLPETAKNVKPEYLATLAINPASAYRMLSSDFSNLQKGDVIIQNGANSMVGVSVMQIANARGIKTINIVRDRPEYDTLAAKLKEYGAYVVVRDNFVNSPEFKKVISDLPKPKLALNCVGGTTVADMIRLLDNGGTVVTYGAMSKKPITIPSSPFIFKDIHMKGFWLSKWIETHSAQERDQMYKDLIDLINSNKLRLWSERHDFSTITEALVRAQQPQRERKVLLSLDK